MIPAPHEIRAAGLFHLLGRLVEIINPHSEVDQPVIRLAGRHAGHIAGKFEQRDVDGAVAHIEAETGLPGALHAERLLEELGRLFRIGNRKRDVTQASNHVSLL